VTETSSQLVLNVLLGIIAATPATIAALLTLWKLSQNTATTERIEGKADVIAAAAVVKTDQIHTLVNSNLTKVTEELTAANARIASLEAMVSKLINSRTDHEEVGH
jgi:hypothetical protein